MSKRTIHNCDLCTGEITEDLYFYVRLGTRIGPEGDEQCRNIPGVGVIPVGFGLDDMDVCQHCLANGMEALWGEFVKRLKASPKT